MLYRSPAQSLLRFSILPLAASAVIFATGCANMVTTASPISTFSQSGDISGKIHGGNQPISGSDVRLYAAGTTGYGSAPTLYATTTSANDGSGSFSFTKNPSLTGPTSGGSTPVYGCPTATDPQMYITARGGATQGTGNGTNLAAAFIIAIGKCSTIGTATLVDMNEITTVATLAALQQYFAPANATSDNLNHLGMPATVQAQAGYANGVSLISNLANVATGTVNTGSTVTSSASGTALSVTVTPETAKIGTLANIISACVNTTSSTSSSCTTLFGAATPPSSSVTSQPALNFGAPTDTLQALYYMLTNPTSNSATNMTTLFNLQSAQAVFQPMEATAPTDWTVGLRYSSTSACASGANFLLYPYHLATDAAGNAWVISNATGGNIFGIAANGTPMACTGGASSGKGSGLTVDINGNIWFAGNSAAATSVYKYVPSTGVTTTWTTGLPVAGGIQALSTDRAGDIFVTGTSGASVYVFPNAANTTTPFAATQIATGLSTSLFFLAADTQNRLFVTNSTTSPVAIYDVYPGVSTDATYLNGYDNSNIATTTTTYNPYGVGAGIAGSLATVNGNTAGTAANTLSLFTPAAGGTAASNFVSAQYAGGITGPRELALDGAGNIWIANSGAAGGNYITGATTSGLFIVSEFTSTGVALSPGNTAATTSNATVNGGFQKDANVAPVAFRGIAIDPSGNVWMGSNSSTGTGITLLVGAAVPVVTPIPAALAAGAVSTNAVSKP